MSSSGPNEGAAHDESYPSFPVAARDALAAAWDEGYEAGQINEHEGRPWRLMTNPYQK